MQTPLIVFFPKVLFNITLYISLLSAILSFTYIVRAVLQEVSVFINFWNRLITSWVFLLVAIIRLDSRRRCSPTREWEAARYRVPPFPISITQSRVRWIPRDPDAGNLMYGLRFAL